MNQLAPSDFAEVEGAIRAATDAILAEQRPDGHWVYELEADATIPAEYVLLVHYLAEAPDLELERKIGVYLRRIQGAHGGWPLYHEGAFDISATVKAYFALKMIGDDIEAPHMKRAREAIHARGGAIKANVFTRILLALYGETSWANVPTVPVELILLPRWFPIHLSKMSYWARTVIVPLLVLAAKRPLARNPRGVHVPELFVPGVPAASPRAPHQSAGWSAFFTVLDWGLKRVEPFWPKSLRARAIEKCRVWTTERLNGEDGLGAIYPAMANSVMMYDTLGYAPTHPDRAIARISVEKLLVIKDHEAYCQPCVSPVWDTALVAHALMETKDATRGSRGGARAGMAGAAPGSGREGRLGGREAGCAAGRLGLPVSQRPLSRSRRYRRGGDGDGPGRQIRYLAEVTGRPSRVARNGSMACRAAMAAGARSTPTIPIITSTTSPSPIMGRCWIRRPRMFPAAASA